MEVETHIDIGEAQRRIEETPTEPIEPPSEQGAFELDQAVVDGACLARSCNALVAC